MIFAILGLRSLYFVLEALRRYLVHLEKAVVVLLFFIAFKLLLSSVKHLSGIGFELSPGVSLGVVLIILTAGIVASLFSRPKAEAVAPVAPVAKDAVEARETSRRQDG